MCPEPEYQRCTDCEGVYSAWSKCVAGYRRMDYIVTKPPSDGGGDCQLSPIEEYTCTAEVEGENSDCTGQWSAWSVCVLEEQVRTWVVDIPKMGEGEDCPASETQTCKPKQELSSDCAGYWSKWSKCNNHKQQRSYVITSPPIGENGAACPASPQDQGCTDDIDCQGAWSAWSFCVGNSMQRQWVSSRLPQGNGLQCPGDVQTEFCHHCTGVWSAWTQCRENLQQRQFIATVEAIGTGYSCLLTPSVQACEMTAEEDTQSQSCEGNWSLWGPCVKSTQRRTWVVKKIQWGSGSECPARLDETQECVDENFLFNLDCEGRWEDSWSRCINGQQEQQYIISRRPSGRGKVCPPLTRTRACTEDRDCVGDWSDWSTCVENRMLRFFLPTRSAFGNGAPCPPMESQR